MNSIRIHLGPMPKMLRAIIGDLLNCEQDLVVVGRSELGQDTLQMVQEEQADVLITLDRARDGDHCLDRILSAAPISILAISDDGRTADAVGLVRRPAILSGGDKSGLAEAVREIAERRAAPAGRRA